jgi:hypothetical protein
MIQPHRAHADLDLPGSGRRRRVDLGEAQVAVAEELEGAHLMISRSIGGPGLRPMKNRQDLDGLRMSPVWNDVRRSWDHQLSRIGPVSGAAAQREARKAAHCCLDGADHASGGSWIIPGDVISDGLQIA